MKEIGSQYDSGRGNVIMSEPFLSIIIANYNYGRFLEAAIESIIVQEMCDKVELIICDAASPDNSVDIIKKYANGLPPNTSYLDWINTQSSNSSTPPLITWWCSEKDSGQSEAFNKGFSHATGRFLTWLNADDVLLPGVVKALYNMANNRPDIHWITGNLIKFEQHNGRILEAPWGPHWVPRWAQGSGFPLSVFGPTTFWSREAYLKVGFIDEKLHYVMDTDYWMRLINAGYRYHRLNRVCWGFRLHEVSKTAIYTNHEPSSVVRHKIDCERTAIYRKNGFHVSAFGRVVASLLRIMDGSRVVDVFRRTFVQGRKVGFKF